MLECRPLHRVLWQFERAQICHFTELCSHLLERITGKLTNLRAIKQGFRQTRVTHYNGIGLAVIAKYYFDVERGALREIAR